MTEIPPAAMTDAAADITRSAGLYRGALTPLEDVRLRLAATYQEFGYRAVEVPVQAPAAIFERKSGSRVIPRIYVLPTSTDQRICLRPEFTPLLVQMFNVRRDAIGIPARLHYGGPVFRRRSGKGGGLETYHESGAELFGVTGPEADAEILSMAIASLRAAGAPEPIVTIGHIDVITSFLHDLELPPSVYEMLLDGLAWDVREPDPQELEQKVLEKIGVATPSSASSAHLGEITREDLHAIGSAMLASLDIPLTGRRTHEEVVERMISRLAASQVGKDVRHAIAFTRQLREAAGPWHAALDATENVLTAADRDLEPVAHLRRVLALLEAGGVDSSAVRVDLALGRGLQYYTGLVFEIIAAGETRVAGGGRYDDLVGLLGGANTAAVGFTIRIDPLADFLQHTSCQEDHQ